MEGATLLHNMSAPSRTTISHTASRKCGRLMVFRLPDGRWSPQEVLERLDCTPWTGTLDEAERELRLRLNRHAVTLPLPHAALLGCRPAVATENSSDFLTICAVIAKSSARVYLRDKEPNLANLRSGRFVLLQLPETEAAS